jgi:hypothetical protein
MLVAVAVTTVGVAAGAWAATDRSSVHAVAPSPPFHAEGLLDASGNPELAVDYFPDGAGDAMHWSMCAPASEPACEIKVAAPPGLSGDTRYGAIVTGDAARWTGGWGSESDQLGIEACRSARATGCVTLSGEELQCSVSGCGSLGGVTGSITRPNRARIGNWYTGWYLFALDAHLGVNESGLVGYSSPAAIGPWPTNATVIRSGPYEPVSGPPPPRVQVLAHARMHGSQLTIASVRCAVSRHHQRRRRPVPARPHACR